MNYSTHFLRRSVMAMGLMLIAFSMFGAFSASAQVTNARVSGEVVDENNEPLPGANVVMVHQPTNTQYGTVTEENGNFNLGNVRVGGPYVIEVSYVGYQSERETGFQLDLGENRSFQFQLEPEAEKLGTVEVTAEESELGTQQGISTTITTEEIESNPTVDRSIADFARLTPQAIVGNDDDDGSSISIAGQNNRYNSIFIDGAVANDVFGLSAQGTDGGQTGATPISTDAIEQFDIEVSPYDITQSYFGGAAINAVTKSGSNQFKGSFTYEYRDENLVEDLSNEPFPKFTNKRYVANLSGPIVEDKLFFFVNVDLNREASPQPFEGGFEEFQGKTIQSEQDLDNFLGFVDNTLGDRYNPGSLRGQSTTLDSDKFLARLDWNISQNHKLMARYSRSASKNVDAFGGSPTQLSFSSRQEVFPNKTQIFATELNSSFGNRFANSLTVSYKTVTDDRDTNLDQPFPTVSINDGPAEIQLGGEPFSTVNFLDQKVWTLTNDFDVYLGDHTLTVGTHNEFYDLKNKFVPFNYGWYFYDSVDAFKQSVCASNAVDRSSVQECAQYPNKPAGSFFLRGFSLVDDDPSTSEFEETIGDGTDAQGAFRALNSSLYIQDKWDVSDKLTFTGGVRVDVPFYLDQPAYANPDRAVIPDDPKVNPKNTTIPAIKNVHSMNGAEPGGTPDVNLHWAPRFGFDYDMREETGTRVRGGTGVFTSRQPFVWPGGMYLNNGTNTGIVANFCNEYLAEEADFAPVCQYNEFRPNPDNGLTVADVSDRDESDLIPSGRLEMFEDGYMNPRFWRTSLAVDQELPGGVTATVEGQYSNTLSNIAVRNVNLRPANGTLDGPDNRPIWIPEQYGDGPGEFSSGQFIDSRYSNIHRVGNTSKGYSYDVTGELKKTFELSDDAALKTQTSYTYGDAFAVNDGTSSQINSLWDGVEHVNGANNVGLSRSDFSIGHRVLARVGYQQDFGDRVRGTITLVYDGQSGRPFSYVIGNSADMVRENGDPNSLVYVPNDASNLAFAETDVDGVTITPQQQAQAFDAFVSDSEYLSSRRGDYAERNATRTPWEGVIDLNARVEIFQELLGRRQSVELTANVFNFSSLLGDVFGTDWGNRYLGPSQVQPMEFQEFKDQDAGDFTPVYSAGRVIENATDTNGDGVADEVDAIERDDLFTKLTTGSSYSSQWQMKFGVSYNF